MRAHLARSLRRYKVLAERQSKKHSQ
jgi:hypothetical protein